MGMTKMSKFLFWVVLFVILSPLVALALDNSLATVEKLATGKDLIANSCTNCHDLQDFLYISDWKHMKTCNITLTEKEKQMMVDFLSSLATFEVKCTSCHNRKKINSAHKTLDQWHETVNKMAVKSAGTFTKEEIDVILVFLIMEQGIR
jgi:cytochrome c5